MKNLNLFFFLFFLSSLFTKVLFAQCDEITVESLKNPGPFKVGTLTEDDGIRNGTDYSGATIYYPINATKALASIAIVPGFVSQPSSVEEWGPFYASHGIVAIIIGTNSLFDLPEGRAVALLDALETIRQENIRVSSPLNGALNLDQLAVSGWSMGGGGAQRAAVLDNTISGVVAMCPFLDNPELSHNSPVLIFSGEADTVARPSEHADIHYSETPNTTDKVLFEVANGDHSVANTPKGADGVVGQIALSWLRRYVEKNECYCTFLKDELLSNPPAASKLEQNFGCGVLGIEKYTLNIGFYPNPTKNVVNFDISGDVYYKLISPLGQLLKEGELTGRNKQINLSEFPASLYYLYIGGQIIKLVKYN